MPIILILIACILAFYIPLLPKLVQARVWVLRKVHLFKLADWHERNQVEIVKTVRIVFVVFILLLVLFAFVEI